MQPNRTLQLQNLTLFKTFEKFNIKTFWPVQNNITVIYTIDKINSRNYFDFQF